MITSTSSSQVKHVMSLLARAKDRRKNGQFVVEGARIVSEVPADRVVKVYMSERFAANNPDYADTLAQGRIPEDRFEVVSDNVFNRMSQTQTPQGVLAVVSMREDSFESMLAGNPFIIMIENLQDPGNLGTIVRMAEGAGVTGIVMSPATVDIYNPKTIRSTMGSIFRVPFVYADDFEDAIKSCKAAGVQVYAASIDAKDDYLAQDYTKPGAILIGNEGNGLTERTLSLADALIKIPMKGQVESLNAAVACTILTYEAVRQRSR